MKSKEFSNYEKACAFRDKVGGQTEWVKWKGRRFWCVWYQEKEEKQKDNECYLVRHWYTDEFGFYEKENIAIYATKELAERAVAIFNCEKPQEGDVDYDSIEDYFYEPYTIRTKFDD